MCALVALAVSILSSPLVATAEQPAKVRRIGWVGLAAPVAEWDAYFNLLRQGLRERGWVEGQNLVIELRWAEGRPERLSELAADLVRLKVELIIANCGPQIDAIRKADPTIPIVVAACPDLVRGGVVASLARPGGNITGQAMLSWELGGKRLEILKEAFPKVSRVAVLGLAAYDWTPYLTEMEHTARALGLRLLRFVGVRRPDDFEGVFAAMSREHADALFVPADPFTWLHRKRILDFVEKNRLPTMFDIREYVDAGGLMSYGPSFTEMWRRLPFFVDRILRGARAGDIPVEQPTRFELVINLKTAKALGLTIPQSVLIRADRVIQ